MAHKIKNNFNNLKSDFKMDTGMDADSNMEVYISYFNARMSDKIMQSNYLILSEMVNKIDQLPGILRMEIAETIRSLKKENVI